MAEIQARNLRATYGRVGEPVLNISSLEIGDGEIVVFYGRNHSGKSTLLKILAGAMRGIHLSKNSSIRYNDMPLAEFGRTSISYLPQRFSQTLFPWMSLRKNLRLRMLAKDNGPDEMSKSVSDMCKFLDFGEERELFTYFGFLAHGVDKRPTDLSGGQQQTLAILRSLLPTPAVLIMDEPFSAIDFYKGPLLRRKVLNFCYEHSITTLIVSHSLEKAVDLADRIVVLERSAHGSVVQNEYIVRDRSHRISLDKNGTFDLIEQIKRENDISD